MLDRFEIGVITSSHGLKGDVKVYPTTDDASRFYEIGEVLLESGRVLELEDVRFFKGRPIVKFRGLDRIEDVEALRGQSLYVTRENAAPLKEGEFYIGDLVGCRVFLEDGSLYGELKDILRTGANDVLEIVLADGSEKLIPMIPSCVPEVLPEEGRIVVRSMREI